MAGEFAHLQLEVVHNAVDAGTPVLKGNRHGLHGRHPRIARGFGLQEAPFPLGVAVGEALLDEAILLRKLLLNFIEDGLGLRTHGAQLPLQASIVVVGWEIQDWCL